jgi:hypothetical protein
MERRVGRRRCSDRSRRGREGKPWRERLAGQEIELDGNLDGEELHGVAGRGARRRPPQGGAPRGRGRGELDGDLNREELDGAADGSSPGTCIGGAQRGHHRGREDPVGRSHTSRRPAVEQGHRRGRVGREAGGGNARRGDGEESVRAVHARGIETGSRAVPTRRREAAGAGGPTCWRVFLYRKKSVRFQPIYVNSRISPAWLLLP